MFRNRDLHSTGTLRDQGITVVLPVASLVPQTNLLPVDVLAGILLESRQPTLVHFFAGQQLAFDLECCSRSGLERRVG